VWPILALHHIFTPPALQCTSMKATDIIRRDHEAIKELFAEFNNTPEDGREDMIDTIFEALDTHEKMEEEHLYHPLKKIPGEVSLDELEHEQHMLKAEVLAARALPGDKAGRIEALMDTVLKHADKEETELLPQAEQVFSVEKLEEMGEEMEPQSVVALTERTSSYEAHHP
jgi:hemerythrin-like domain-containing protein